LIDDQGRAAVAAHPVDHAHECRRGNDRESRCRSHDGAAAGGEQRQGDQRCPPAETIAADRDGERCERGAGKPARDDCAYLRGVEPDLREIDAEEYGNHAGRECANEGCPIDDVEGGEAPKRQDVTRGHSGGARPSE